MNDISFNLDYMSIVLRDCSSAVEEVKDCTYDFIKIADHMEKELSSFSTEGKKAVRNVQAHISETRDLIRELDGKASKAESKKKKELPPPQKPSVPEKATPEQKNAIMSDYHNKASRVDAQNAEIRKQNERIDAYVSKCKEGKSKLEELISHLHRVESSMKSEIDLSVSKAHEFTGHTLEIKNTGSRVLSAMNEFCSAFSKAYDDAGALYSMEPMGISSYSYMDRLFVIKNTHSHTASSGGGVFNFSYNDSEPTQEKASVKAPRSDGELLIKEREEASFLEAIATADKVRMPSANLHKLGSKKFIAKMNEIGFSLVNQEDGSTIDSSGMLHWERVK